MSIAKPKPDFSEIASRIPQDGHIVIHSAFAEPTYLTTKLGENAGLFKGVNLHNLMSVSPPLYAEEAQAELFKIETFYPGSGLRRAVNRGQVKTRRCILSDLPRIFATNEIKANLLILQVSPPNERGEVSLGVSIDYMPEVIAQRPIIVAQINPRMPFTCGDTRLSLEAVDYCIEIDEPLQSTGEAKADPVDLAIAENVASLIEDGDVIQAGIGALPDAVLGRLGHLKNLGAHTGILTNAWLPLIHSGVVDNSRKKVFAGISVTTMAGGNEDFYRFLHNNSSIEFYPCSLTHKFESLAAIDRLCTINSVLQVDLAGNGNAESAGGRIIATPGGLPDFARGSSAARNGKSIIAIRSSFKNGEISNILCDLGPDTPVSLESEAIGFVVTEYGVAALKGLDTEARAQALIAIAHPDHQEGLSREWRQSQRK